ncbi:DUF2271 domain-containing protein [Neptunitalea lumnitzerae]|uniref:DUF2271 domain-containing protein n=1 Tax=Neptunitalea lumnitzerae TaxID=2965509 RepID=A0ABQ5MIR9_9FLAO|nr:DUF2271 domain-containing protein [Neptunitalea sp. Y10]GLB49311.1 hypothetical protein Y10_16790 [Neptunitalea sp. Y10]
MKNITYKMVLLAVAIFSMVGFTASNTFEAQTVKCLLQTKNYTGEGAYIAVSLINDKGGYEQTLYMVGDDSEWYESLQQWYRGIGHKEDDVDAISGATINPGARAIIAFDVPKEKLDKGYKIRFESAVEDQEYYTSDLEVPFTTESLNGKFEGTGYIRYIRLISK